MKRLTLITFMLMFAATLPAQKLAIGTPAPDLHVKEWPYGKPSGDNNPKFIEFLYTKSTPSLERISKIDDMAVRFGSRLNVIVICRESAETIRSVVGNNPAYRVGIDEDGRTFSAYGIQYVPFGVITDAKGRIVWFGNPGLLSDHELAQYVK